MKTVLITMIVLLIMPCPGVEFTRQKVEFPAAVFVVEMWW